MLILFNKFVLYGIYNKNLEFQKIIELKNKPKEFWMLFTIVCIFCISYWSSLSHTHTHAYKPRHPCEMSTGHAWEMISTYGTYIAGCSLFLHWLQSYKNKKKIVIE